MSQFFVVSSISNIKNHLNLLCARKKCEGRKVQLKKSAREEATGELILNLDACSFSNDDLKMATENLKLLNGFMISCLKFHHESPYHIEINPLIFSANQWTDFYVAGTYVMKELKFHEVLEEVIQTL